MRLIVTTQYRENYGAHSWDGNGVCPQYWKNKGGIEYSVTLPDAIKVEDLPAIMETVRAKVTRYNDFVEEYVIDWHILATGESTHKELMELEYEGFISPPREITL